MNKRARISTVFAAGTVALLVGCGEDTGAERTLVDGGSPERGRVAVLQYGCASCHAMPDVPSVDNDLIAPDLRGFDDRHYIAGQIPNRPEELVRWLRNPQAIAPGTVMPNMGVTEQDARDIAAYLYDQ